MLVQKAVAAGAVPLASRIPVYEEVLGDGERGLLFEAGDAEVLAEQLVRLVSDSRLRERAARTLRAAHAAAARLGPGASTPSRTSTAA